MSRITETDRSGRKVRSRRKTRSTPKIFGLCLAVSEMTMSSNEMNTRPPSITFQPLLRYEWRPSTKPFAITCSEHHAPRCTRKRTRNAYLKQNPQTTFLVGSLGCRVRRFIIIIIILLTMFMVLSSWHSHCQSSPGSFDEWKIYIQRERPYGRWDSSLHYRATNDSTGTIYSSGFLQWRNNNNNNHHHHQYF